MLENVLSEFKVEGLGDLNVLFVESEIKIITIHNFQCKILSLLFDFTGLSCCY